MHLFTEEDEPRMYPIHVRPPLDSVLTALSTFKLKANLVHNTMDQMREYFDQYRLSYALFVLVRKMPTRFLSKDEEASVLVVVLWRIKVKTPFNLSHPLMSGLARSNHKESN